MSSSLNVSLSFGQLIVIRYVESILFSTGIIGSILNLVLFSQRKYRRSSCCQCLFIFEKLLLSIISNVICS